MNQQTCKVCGRPDKFDFHVPDTIWLVVVGEQYSNRVVCLPCFDTLAHAKGIDYARSLQALYFAGERACFGFTVTWGVSVD